MTETVTPRLMPAKSLVVLGATKRLGLAAVAVASKATQIASVPLLITVTILRCAFASVSAVVVWLVPEDVISSVTA